jgi:hypothetical protein
MDAMLGAAAVHTGGRLLTTVTVNEPVDELPCESDAVQSTVVVPASKCEPDAGVQLTGTLPSMSSVAVAVKVTVAPTPGAVTVKLAGNESTGGTPSTVIVNVADPVRPTLSVAVDVTVVVPSGNFSPHAGSQV